VVETEGGAGLGRALTGPLGASAVLFVVSSLEWQLDTPKAASKHIATAVANTRVGVQKDLFAGFA